MKCQTEAGTSEKTLWLTFHSNGFVWHFGQWYLAMTDKGVS